MLMVSNDNFDYCYSVGGRIKMGESSKQAVIREVYEETRVHMDIDHLAYIHENFFVNDSLKYEGMQTYEISYYYVMNVPENFEPICNSVTGDNVKERLEWIAADTNKTIYPEFFIEELLHPSEGVKHIITNEL